jgi:NAD(P)-dependent dehydrogenase (short-subunit alcohol dehydrogenase family)
MLAKCAALDLCGRGIRVNSVAPGLIDTRFQSKFFSSPEEQTKQLTAIGEKLPLGRIPSTQGITNAILFLASDLAADITGTEQVVDCGHAIGWIS